MENYPSPGDTASRSHERASDVTSGSAGSDRRRLVRHPQWRVPRLFQKILRRTMAALYALTLRGIRSRKVRNLVDMRLQSASRRRKKLQLARKTSEDDHLRRTQLQAEFRYTGLMLPDVTNWHGVRVMGAGGQGMAGVWVEIDPQTHRISDHMVVKEAQMSTQEWNSDTTWVAGRKHNIPKEAGVALLLALDDNINIQTIIEAYMLARKEPDTRENRNIMRELEDKLRNLNVTRTCLGSRKDDKGKQSQLNHDTARSELALSTSPLHKCSFAELLTCTSSSRRT